METKLAILLQKTAPARAADAARDVANRAGLPAHTHKRSGMLGENPVGAPRSNTRPTTAELTAGIAQTARMLERLAYTP